MNAMRTVIVEHRVKRVRLGMIHESSKHAVMRKAVKAVGGDVTADNWEQIKWDFPRVGSHTVSFWREEWRND